VCSYQVYRFNGTFKDEVEDIAGNSVID